MVLTRVTSEKEESIFSEVIGWIGTGLGILYFLFPVIMIIQMLRKECTYKDVNLGVLLTNFFNCLLWTAYGNREGKTQLWVYNASGAFVSAIWVGFYLVYFAELNILKSLFYIIICFNFGGEIFYVFYKIVVNIEVVRYACLVIGVLMFYAPGLKMVKCIKTKNRNLIPIYLSVLLIFSCSSWVIHGIMIKDISLSITKSLGIFFAILQTSIWIWCRAKYPDGEVKSSTSDSQKKKEPQKEEKAESPVEHQVLQISTTYKDTNRDTKTIEIMRVSPEEIS